MKMKPCLALFLLCTIPVCAADDYAATKGSDAASGAEVSAGPRTIDVKDLGAKGDCRRVTDGAMTKGSTGLTSATARFTPADVGKPIYVLEAGAQKFPGLGTVLGAPLSSRIVAVTDARTVTLADAAQQDVSGVSVTWGTDDSQAIQSAIDSLNQTGGTVFFPPGTYRVTYRGGAGLNVNGSNIRLHGTGPASAILNSSVIFHAKAKDGVACTEQMGVPALYVGRGGLAVENVEVDHLWLGDNGQKYSFANWGPEGPGVFGTKGTVNHFSFHDLTIETKHLCGLNTDSQTVGFSISNVTVLCSANHGFYLAGTASDGDVSNNRILGTTAPMRMGIAIKKKSNIRVTHNEVANVDFQGISLVGDDPSYISRNVLIADNWIHDLRAWHTDAITVFNAANVTIRGNRITDTRWIGINLRTWRYTVAQVAVKDNFLTRVGSRDSRDPCFAINVLHYPPPKQPANVPWPGSVSDIAIENNVISDSPRGISFVSVGGTNVIRGNRVENRERRESSVGYNIDPLPSSTTVFSNNVGVNCARYIVSPKITSAGNSLK
jgi:hypothetical protein